MTALIGTLVLLGALVAIALVLISGRGMARTAWRAGYWQGKADVHESLNAYLVEHEHEYIEDPALLALGLTEWYANEVISDRALSIAQGLVKEEKHG